MTLIQRIIELAKAIGADIKTLKSRVLTLETKQNGTQVQTTEKKYVYRTPKGASWLSGNSYFQLTRIGNLVVAGADGDSYATISITPPTDSNFNKLPKRESTVDGKGGTWLQIQKPNNNGGFQSNFIIPEGFAPVKSTYGMIVNDNGIPVATVMFGDKANKRVQQQRWNTTDSNR